MKHVQFFLFLCLLPLGVGAQEYTTPLTGIEWVEIKSASQITVKVHSSNTLVIKPEKPFKAPEAAKGLRLVTDEGFDNTFAGFSVVTEGNKLIVASLKCNNNGKTTLFLPSNTNIKICNVGHNDVTVSGFKGEIEIGATGNINIKDVSGPITANACGAGKVMLVFGTVNQNYPISISTATGDIDVSLPANTPANLNLQSHQGNIYTDFDLKMPNKEGLESISSKSIQSSINNGGVNIQLHSSTGNIFLRKK